MNQTGGLFNKQTITKADLSGKTVLIRVDFNVPINEHGVITDDYRIRQALPTIEHCLGHKAKVVIISHLGRPKDFNDKSCSLEPVARVLQDLLHKPVKFENNCIGDKANIAKESLNPGEILLLENLRYHTQEESHDSEFAKQLANGCDVFVQEAFGTAHRSHASMVAITNYLPSYAGFLLSKEVSTLQKVISTPDRPLAVIIGGAKISDKINLLKKFIDVADFVAVVGAMANTFLLAMGKDIGKSIAEPDAVKEAKEILFLADSKSRKQAFTFYLPHDVVVAGSLDSTAHTRPVDIDNNTWADITSYPKHPPKELSKVGKNEYIVDIGPISASYIAGALSQSKTAIWNGTAGITEVKGVNGASAPFSHATNIIAQAMRGEYAGFKNKPFTVVGGGDTVGYIESVPGLREQLGLVSTGGGASLELLSGSSMPGIDSLLDN
jgi:phosphoglycerate kinase